MPKPKPEIHDSSNYRELNNPPEWYDYIDERYTCMTRDAFSGRLSVSKTFPKVAMLDDWNKIIEWAMEKKIIKISGDADENKIDRQKLYRDSMALVKYLSIPQKDRKELYGMFRTSTITKTEKAIKKHKKILKEIKDNWQPSLLDLQEIIKNKIAYYEDNLKQFKENTKNYGFNFELPQLLKPIMELLTGIGFSKQKARSHICDLLEEKYKIDTDSFKIKHYTE